MALNKTPNGDLEKILSVIDLFLASQVTLVEQREQADGNTSLHIAVACFSPELTAKFIKFGCADVKNNRGQTALTMARELQGQANEEVTDFVREVKVARIVKILSLLE